MILYNSENSIRDGTALGSGLTASAPVSDVSAPAYTNGVWPRLRLVSVGQSIDLPIEESAAVHRPPLVSVGQSIDLAVTERSDGSG